jgi:ectoine hydroxylase-related dioxygenase (phytanoyl-CoA dioxygenase family)
MSWTNVLIVLAIVACLAYAYYMSGRSFDCTIDLLGSGSFCAIKKIDLTLPEDVRASIMRQVNDRTNGTRVEIPKVRAGRTMTASYIRKTMPGLIDEYRRAAHAVGRAIGQDVSPASLETELSLAVIVYEKKRDGIHWHYDDNYFRGRFFTLLVPVTLDDTCTVFEYKDLAQRPQSVRLEPGEALLFEGSKLLHRATPLCDGQRRVVVSMQFATDVRIKNRWLMKLKEIAFTGMRFW